MLLALAAFFFTRGRIMLEADEESGRKILRFNAFERFTHWMTAACFILLAISGLNYIFGKRLLMPLIGPDAFAAWSQYAKLRPQLRRLAVHARRPVHDRRMGEGQPPGPLRHRTGSRPAAGS